MNNDLEKIEEESKKKEEETKKDHKVSGRSVFRLQEIIKKKSEKTDNKNEQS